MRRSVPVAGHPALPRRATRGRPWWALSLAAPSVLVALAGCSTPDKPAEQQIDDAIAQVPVPPADGPKLVALRHHLLVRDRPSPKGLVIGELRIGGQIARAATAYSSHRCPGGWYPIRPRGFVCAGAEASIEPSVPAAALLPGPDLDAPLPYRYARVRGAAAVSYAAVPTAEQQQQAEPKTRRRHLEVPGGDEPLGMGANDVPLDERGMPTGPAVVAPGAAGVGADGYRTAPAYLDFGAEGTLQAGLSLAPAAGGADFTRILKRKSGVALAASGAAGTGGAARAFGILPSGRFIPSDRLRPALGSTFHGMDLSDGGLPVAFTLRGGVHTYQMDKGKAVRGDEPLGVREAVRLTGRYRTVSGVRYYFSADDGWLRHRDIILIPKRNQFPDFAGADQKWMDVSLANQTMVLWEGHKPLYATLISSGRDRLGDPSTGPSTVQGVFRVRSKHVSRDVDAREVDLAYSLHEAPWVIEFAEGFALTGCYWRSRFGEALGYHNVALSPIDAHLLFGWSEPQVPEGWHGIVVPKDAASTVIYVHR